MTPAADLLTLLPRAHVTEAYKLDHLWGVDRESWHITWWSWRCSCGRDLGAERKAAYGSQAAAEQMAAHHRRGREPWHDAAGGVS